MGTIFLARGGDKINGLCGTGVVGVEWESLVWNSMYMGAGLLLTHRGGPGWVGSALRAPRFHPGAER